MRARIAVWTCVTGVVCLGGALAATFTSGGHAYHPEPLDRWYPIDLALFAIAVLALRRVARTSGRPRPVPVLVLAGTVAVLATGLLQPPRTSTDSYRYLWDGRVQAAGISPYAHAPDDPALAGLRARAPDLFPVGTVGTECQGWDLRRAAPGFCSRVNRPAVHTIYPPVAEGYFAVLYGLGGSYGVRSAQAGGLLLAVGVTALLLYLLPPERRWQAALWGWFPGVAVWAVNDGHVDTLGVLLTVGGLAAAARHRRSAGGVLLGAAIATKLIPVLALPGAMAGVLARRPRIRDLTLPVIAVVTVALAYLPYVLASGSGVVGYLFGYLEEEGYDPADLRRFALIRLVVPEDPAMPAAVLVVAAVALAVLRFGDPRAPWSGALVVFGVALLALTPGYPWYGLLLVGLVALDGRWEWLGVPLAAQVVYLDGSDLQVRAYGAALVMVVAGYAARWVARRPGGEGRRSGERPPVARPVSRDRTSA